MKGLLRSLAAPALVALAACGPAMSGTVGGREFSATQAISRDSVVTEPHEMHQLLVIVGGRDTSDLCRDIENRKLEKDSTYVELAFGDHGPLEPGEFAIRGNSIADGRFGVANAIALDGACKESFRKRATKGTITLGSVSKTGMSGSFSLEFEGGETLEGEFSSASCSAVRLVADECG